MRFLFYNCEDWFDAHLYNLLYKAKMVKAKIVKLSNKNRQMLEMVGIHESDTCEFKIRNVKFGVFELNSKGVQIQVNDKDFFTMPVKDHDYIDIDYLACEVVFSDETEVGNMIMINTRSNVGQMLNDFWPQFNETAFILDKSENVLTLVCAPDPLTRTYKSISKCELKEELSLKGYSIELIVNSKAMFDVAMIKSSEESL